MKYRLRLKVISVFTLIIFLNQLFFPTISFALTGGPSQPETAGFQEVGSNNMVDLFSGDFSYSIPLLDVGGYPVGLNYQAGVSMDQEASMVGLGWSLTPGAINRNVRGIPDDFKGDIVKQERNVKDNRTVGGSVTVPIELLGFQKLKGKGLTATIGVYNNSYNGWGSQLNFGKSWNLKTLNSTSNAEAPNEDGTSKNDTSANAIKLKLSIGFDSQTGISANPNLSLAYTKSSNSVTFDDCGAILASSATSENLSMGLGLSFRSAKGMTGLAFNMVASSYAKQSSNGNSSIEGYSGQASSSFPIGYTSYMPVQQYNMRNFNLSFDLAIAKEALTVDWQTQMNAYYSTQFLPEDEKKTDAAAYGSMYYERVNYFGNKNRQDQLLDFNRSSDFPYSPKSEYLHMSQTTYDIFSISGQGTGGAFKLNSYDVPIYGDPVKENRSVGMPISSLGLDFGTSIKGGGNLTVSSWDEYTGAWTSSWSNDYIRNNDNYFTDADLLFEKKYFKAAGEMVGIDENYIEDLNGYEPSKLVVIADKLNGFRLTDELVTDYGVSKTVDLDAIAANRTYERQPRTKSIRYFTNKQAKKYGLNSDIYTYGAIFNTKTAYVNPPGVPYNRSTLSDSTSPSYIPARKPHHIGGFEITETDGTRYLYDIPTYNNASYNVAFSIEGANDDSYHYYENYRDSSGLIHYNAKEDASIDNDNGRDNYYTKQSTPAHAGSYLLTGIMSPDYIDVEGDGITVDDLGTAVKFNYTRHSNSYGWRAPYGKNKARYNAGLQSVNYDDKATYSYGSKELWYVHSIESKTHVAEFYYSVRKDAIGVSDERGTKGTADEQRMLKLDKIELYNKVDRFTKLTDATPLKVVHFEYDYSLCQGLPNHELTSGENGKLTLKKVYFTYGESMKAGLSPYVFKYSDFNPNYDLQAYDRWGTYKPYNSALPNEIYPYTEQNTTSANQYASAWNLSKIKLPSGGTISINYEADDYDYVMEKRAHQMIQTIGVGDSEYTHDMGGLLYDDTDEYYYLYFNFKSGETFTSDDEVKDAYMPDNHILFYKSSIYLRNKSEPELFSGFAEIEDMGLAKNDAHVGWVKLKPYKLDLGTKMNPISLNSWDFILKNLNQKVFESSQIPNEDSKLKSEFKSLVKNIGALAGFVVGKYRQMRLLRYAKELIPSETFIRLKESTHFKKGGGYRVKSIVMNDNWDKVSSSESFDYGVEYHYNTINQDGDTASSGVASYEPGFGNEENPYFAPIYYDNYKIKGIDSVKFGKALLSERVQIIGPIGETFFPNPMVGYSEVKVTSLNSNMGTPTGYTKSRFYTTKDFPIHIKKTAIDPIIKPVGDPITRFLINGKSGRYVAASQGYTVFSNDMHGKPESTLSYNSDGMLISGAKYYYKTGEIGASTDPVINLKSELENFDKNISYSTSWLNNKVKVIDKTGKLSDREIGIEFDMSIDTKADNSESFSRTYPSNLDIVVIGAIPLPIPSLYFHKSHSIDKFRSVTVTKVVQQHGIMHAAVAFDENSVVSTENLIWDEMTGQVLMTQTGNEYEDKITSFNYPGYYAYKNIGPSSQNEGLVLHNVDIINGVLELDASLHGANKYFAKGDEISLTYIQDVGTSSKPIASNEKFSGRCWVKGIKSPKVYLVDKAGFPINGSFNSLKIIRSGHRNILNASVGSFVSMEEPDTTDSLFSPPALVTQTAASTLSDEWQVYSDQVRYKKCGITSNGYMLQKILDSLADANWFSNNQASLNEAYNLYKLSNYAGSSIDKGFSDINYYLRADHSTCDSVLVYDTSYIYKLFYERNSWQLTAPLSEYYTEGTYPTTWPRMAGINDSAKLLGWQLHHMHIGSKYIYSPCSHYDTIKFSQISETRVDSNTMVLALYIGSYGGSASIAKVQRPPYCNMSFQTAHGETIDWSTIDSFGNIRVDNMEDGGTHFLIDAYIEGIPHTLRGNSGPCFEVVDCWYECEATLPDTINPYLTGIRGVWRGKDNFAFNDMRQIAGSSVNYGTRSQIRLDGQFDYDPFWQFSSGGLIGNGGNNWISPATLTIASPAGNLIESIDALDRPSAEVYGYDRKLVTIVGQNSHHHDLAFDGFEEYDYPFYNGCMKQFHWSLQEDSIGVDATRVIIPHYLMQYYDLDSLYAVTKLHHHTGRASLFVASNRYISATDQLFINDTTTASWHELEPFQIDNGNVIQKFAPEKGRKYVVSGWVKEIYVTGGNVNDYEAASLKVKINNTGYEATFNADGPIIDGWQRIYGEFTIPDDTAAHTIQVYAQVDDFIGTGACFDDIRIQPYNSMVKTYVYDPLTLRLIAELDENNFATYYEYDGEGRLLRIKKETDRGIVTLQESRYGIPKTN
ncbi:hypothetical protein GC194_02195 [bacterium]|nr:hypothetical protein [bacterium]